MTQTDRLIAVLSDLAPHRTDEIVEKVYGPGCSLARVAARVYNVKRKVAPGWTVKGWKDAQKPTLYWYQLVAVA